MATGKNRINTGFLTLLVGLSLTAHTPFKATVYSAVAQGLEYLDPQGVNLTKLILTTATAVFIAHKVDTLERQLDRLAHRLGITSWRRLFFYTGLSVAAWNFWSIVLPGARPQQYPLRSVSLSKI